VTLFGYGRNQERAVVYEVLQLLLVGTNSLKASMLALHAINGNMCSHFDGPAYLKDGFDTAFERVSVARSGLDHRPRVLQDVNGTVDRPSQHYPLC
jgi:hypothetical protein